LQLITHKALILSGAIYGPPNLERIGESEDWYIPKGETYASVAKFARELSTSSKRRKDKHKEVRYDDYFLRPLPKF